MKRWLPAAVFAVAAFAAPLALSGNRYFAFIAGITLISVTWATGMNLLYGYTGLMPLMFAGIAGISAYITVGLSANGWSFWVSMLLGSLGASLVGIVLGLPSLRLRGFYFTLCSLVIQTVITLAFVYFINLTNGDTGISQIPLPEIPGGGRLSGLGYDLVLAAVAAIGVAVLAFIVESPFGRRLIAIREDDGLAETLGINVTRQKLAAFFIASLFAAAGGALYAPYVGFVSPRSFDVLVSLNVWLMVAFGGRGTIWGPIVGAVLLAPVPFLLQDYYMIKDVVYGALIIGVIVLLPAGIAGGVKRLARPAGDLPIPAAKAASKPTPALKPEQAR
jgi:branched-chain amino acid transport system permease protein